MAKSQEVIIKEERKKALNFIIALLIGLVGGTLIEAVIILFNPITKPVAGVIIVLSIFIIIYLYSLFKKTNSIRDYNQYEIIFEKRIKQYKWKKFYGSIRNNLKESLRKNKISLLVLPLKIYWGTKFNHRLLVNDVTINYAYIDFYEDFEGKSKIIVKTISNQLGDRIIKSLEESLKEEANVEEHIKKRWSSHLTGKVFRNFWTIGWNIEEINPTEKRKV